ncbi:MAG: hypothetical protein JWO11_1058 [Nocardioides sp.]|nr:hypothetical protein [Nocardioides sp.]
MSVSRPLAGIAAASALMLSGLLSGCGIAGTSWHPGAAADVGAETISVDHVDYVTTNYCSAIADQLTQAGNVLPLRYLREGVTGQLVLVSAARQLGKEYAVGTGDQYNRKVAQLEQAVAALPTDEQAAVIEIESSDTYVTDILTGVGNALAVGQEKPTSDQAVAAGQQALTKWIADHGVEIDPAFGVEIVDGKSKPIDTDLSFAAGTTAKAGSATSPDPAYASALPATQRCG